MNPLFSFVIRLIIAIAITWALYTVVTSTHNRPSNQVTFGEIAPSGVTKSLEPSYEEIPDGVKTMQLRRCYYPCYNIA